MEIEGYSNYLIYEDGRVFSKKRKIFLKSRDNGRGYHTVHLCKDGRHKHYLVHRLVAIHYIPNPHNYPEVDHKDRDKENNSIDNLRWVTRSMNNQNTGIFITNKLGISNISFGKQGYRFDKRINGKRHHKCFKTLDEALKYKEEYITNLQL